MMTNHGEESVNVILKPFAHQVAGHNPVLTVGGTIICKPTTKLEEEFYQNPPDELMGYIPLYKGTAEVTCRYTERDIPELSAFVPRSIVDDQENFHQQDYTSPGSNQGENGSAANVATSQFIERIIEKKGYWNTSRTEHFILLENVVAGFRYPCILDIKLGTSNLMGTEDDDKRKLLLDRVQSTISISHGLRLHGMRVLKYPQCQFEIQKKDWGRTFSKSEELFKEGVKSYLCNGARFREDVRKAICKKIRDLEKRGLHQGQYELYACSLLVIYEGEDVLSSETLCENTGASQNGTRVEVKLIDFAKTNTSACDSKNDRGGIVLGLRNLLRILETIDS